MIKVKNRKVIRNLSKKSYKANKTRNLIAIMAIALTSLLFTTLYTMGMSAIDSMQQATMRQAGGDGHAVIKYINDDVFAKINDHPLVNEIAYRRILSDGVLNREFLKHQTEFWYYDDVALKLGFIDLSGPFNTSSMFPTADIIEWRYKVENNKLYKRQYNYSKSKWIGDWELVE